MRARFGQYEILEELGRGGMGVVYKARQVDLDRIVALKVMHRGLNSPQARGRFRREAKALAKLRHPNIVRLLSVGQVEDRHYLTMDCIEGRPFSALIPQAQTPEDRDRLVRIVATVARAVHHAHTKGIIHRDLKPPNILVNADGVPFITDFGIAKELGDAETITLSSSAAGTAAYMPPEQAQGRREDIGPGSDVYALGAVLYEVLTGRPPFQGPTPAAVLHKVCCETPVLPRRIDPAISRSCEAICLRCLQKQPEARYESAETLANDIEKALAGQAVAARGVALRRLAVYLARHRRWQIITAAMAIFVSAGLLAVWRSRARGRRAQVPGASGLTHESVDRLLGDLEAERGAEEERRRQREVTRRAKEEKATRARAEAARRKAELEQVVQRRLAEEREATRRAGTEGAGAQKKAEAKSMSSFAPPASAQAGVSSYWRATRVNCLGVAGDDVWWGSRQGVFRLDARTGQTLFHPIGGTPNAIAFDRGGTGWFGTEKGVCSFDGESWRTYTREDGLAGTRVRAVVIDAEGRKWFGMYGSVSCLAGRAWTTHPLQDSSGRFVVEALAVAPDQSLWAACTRFGASSRSATFALARLQGAEWRVYPGTTEPKLTQLPMRVGGMAIDAAGRKWLATSHGVRSFHRGEWTVYTSADGLVHDNVYAVTIDHTNTKWFGTQGGVSRFDDRCWRTYRPPDWPGSYGFGAVAVDAQGRRWFGSPVGLWHLDGTTWRRYGGGSGLPADQVRSIAVDARGRKWIATQEGVTCFDGRSWRTYTTSDGLPRNDICAVVVDPQDRVWAATYLDGVSSFDGKSWRTHAQTAGTRSRPKLATDPQGRVWFVAGRRLLRFDGRTWTDCEQEIQGSGITALTFDAQGRRWVATNRGTVTCSDGGGSRTYTQKDGLNNHWQRINAIACDHEGTIWVAGSARVFSFDGTSWRLYSHRDSPLKGSVCAILVDAQNRKWIGCSSGLTCFDGKSWRIWTDADGLAAGTVRALALDVDGSVWAGTDKGVSHISLKPKD